MTDANSTRDLVDQAYSLRSAIADLEDKLEAIELQLIAQGRGDYAGTDPAQVAKVIVPSAPEPGYKLEAANEDRARELAGEKFGDIFVRKVTFSCDKAFDVLCKKFLTPAKAKKLLALCRVKRKTQDPYVNFA